MFIRHSINSLKNLNKHYLKVSSSSIEEKLIKEINRDIIILDAIFIRMVKYLNKGQFRKYRFERKDLVIRCIIIMQKYKKINEN